MIYLQKNCKYLILLQVIALSIMVFISRKLLAYCICGFTLVDMYILFYEKINKNKIIILSLLGISMMASLPLFLNGINLAHDLLFHLKRIEAIAFGIRNKTFPVKLSLYWNSGYGYPVSIYYGDMLLYLPAFLRLCGFTVVTTYKIFVVLVNMGTAAISYACFKRIWKDKGIALLTCMAYMIAGYRIVDIYVRAAIGEVCAMMFLPIVAMSIYKIYTDDYTNWKNYRTNALWLCIGMSGVIGTHILTTGMVIFAILLICIVLLKRTLHKNTIGVFALSIVGTLMLSSYFIVPFLDYSLHEPVEAIQATSNISRIQSEGTYIGQYFGFFQTIYGKSTENISERMQLTPGPILMGAILFVFYFIFRNKKNKEMHFMAVFSCLILFFASNLFPWDLLASHFKIINLLAAVQFPWRYITLAIVFLTMLMGCILKMLMVEDFALYKKIFVLVVGVGIVMSCFYLRSYRNDAYMAHYREATEFNTESDSLYFPPGTDQSLFDGSIASENMNFAEITYRKGSHIELDCEAGMSEGGTVSIPVLNYKGYHVTDENGTEYEIFDSTNNTIQFTLPAKFSGKVFVDYKEPWFWRIAEVVSLLTLLLFILHGVYRRDQLISACDITK